MALKQPLKDKSFHGHLRTFAFSLGGHFVLRSMAEHQGWLKMAFLQVLYGMFPLTHLESVPITLALTIIDPHLC